MFSVKNKPRPESVSRLVIPSCVSLAVSMAVSPSVPRSFLIQYVRSCADRSERSRAKCRPNARCICGSSPCPRSSAYSLSPATPPLILFSVQPSQSVECGSSLSQIRVSFDLISFSLSCRAARASPRRPRLGLAVVAPRASPPRRSRSPPPWPSCQQRRPPPRRARASSRAPSPAS